MKKMITPIIIISLMIFLLDQCSVYNISSSKIFKKKEFDTYKYLKDSVNSKEYEVVRISDFSYNSITYDTINNYFIVANRFGIKKINHKGKVVKTLKSLPHIDLDYTMFKKTHYAFSDSLVYDFSEKDIIAKPFKSIIIPPKKNASEKNWLDIFIENYKIASVVLYGNYPEIEKGYPIFMKINSEWRIMYANYHLSQNENGELEVKGYPEKVRKLIYLKDQNNNCYSDWGNKKNSDSDLSLERNINYPSEPIEKLYFQKELSLGQLQYTNITERYGGTAYYRIKKGSDIINFKENAIKNNMFFSKIESYLFHFSIPKTFSTKSNITFIQLSYPTNINESGSNGLYIIKRKNNE